MLIKSLIQFSVDTWSCVPSLLFTWGQTMDWRRKWQPPPAFLPGESQGRGSLAGCRLWGRTESDTTEATQQQTDGGNEDHGDVKWESRRVAETDRLTDYYSQCSKGEVGELR